MSTIKTTKDALLVLSDTLMPSSLVPGRNVINRNTKRRVEKAVELYGKREARVLIMQGGPGVVVSKGNWALHRSFETTAEWVPLGTRPVIADLMKTYAEHLGVPEDSIYVQPFSCDCVSEAIFAYGMFLRQEARGWNNNIVVTSTFNVARVTEIYQHVLGQRFTTTVIGSSAEEPIFGDTKAIQQALEEKEAESLAAFRRDFGDISPGDLGKLVERLYNQHPYFKDIPQKYRMRFHSAS